MLIQFTTPKNLNGAELLAELSAAGVLVVGNPYIDENKDLWLDITEADKSKTVLIVAAHNGNTLSKEPTPAEKLFNATGLTVEEYKALGL